MNVCLTAGEWRWSGNLRACRAAGRSSSCGITADQSRLDVDAETELVVVGDETPHADRLMAAAESLDDSARQAWQEGRLQLVRESELWARLGLVDSGEKSNGCIRR